MSGYAPLVGRPAPAAVRPREGESGALVAVLDADCAQCHDFASWSHAIVDAKDSGVADWVGSVPRLRDLGPAEFPVDDPHRVSTLGTGSELDDNLHAAWELESPVGRAVSQEHLAHT